MEIIKYNSSYKSEWDKFIDTSKNGTFLFKRDYMEYHSDRFTDCSYMFYKKKKLIAVIPGNINQEQKTFFSHQGLTYGGLVLSYEITASQVIEIFNDFIPYLKVNWDIENIIYKTIPRIYHKYPAEEDLYALFRHNAYILERKISSTLPLKEYLPFHRFRRRGIQKGIENNLTIKKNEDMSIFWEILNEVLLTQHNTRPVHTLKEITYLKNAFPKEISLFEVYKDEKAIAGCVIYETSKTIHVQYIASSEEGKRSGALDFLFHYLITDYYFLQTFFDFGVSVEQGGRYLNEGLISQKEGFGGRAIIYDTYKIQI